MNPQASLFPSAWLKEAQANLAPHIRITPLTYDPQLDIYLKWENHQLTGSFKARGALNKILSLQPWEREKGIVAASAGNHGQGVALAARLFNAPVVVFASENAPAVKVQAMRELGAEVRLVPGGYGEAEIAGIEYARASDMTWVSPYNDGKVIAGQATLGMETLAQLPPGTQFTWLVPVGGGGLIAGIGAAIKSEELAHSALQARLIGVQSVASPFMYHLYHHGSQDGVREEDSLADGLSGPVEANSITIPLTRTYVDDFVLVTEEEIAQAIRFAWQRYHERIEGSAAAALAAALSGRVNFRPAVVVISGGNIQPELHQRLVNPA